MRRLIWIAAVVAVAGGFALGTAGAEDHEDKPGCSLMCAETQKKCVEACSMAEDQDDCVEACQEALEECMDTCD